MSCSAASRCACAGSDKPRHTNPHNGKQYYIGGHESWPKTDTVPSIRPILEIKDIPDKAIIAFGEYPQFKETNKEICDTLTKAKNRYNKS